MQSTRSDGLYIVNHKKEITFANDIAKRLLELDNTTTFPVKIQCLPTNVFNFEDSEGNCLKKDELLLNESFVSKLPESKIIRWKTKKNNIDTYFQITSTPILSEKGNIVNIVCVTHNITEQINNERYLRENEETFRKLAEKSYDLISITNLNGLPLWTNAAWRHICGESDYNEDPFKNIHPEDKTDVLKAWEQMISKKKDIKHLEYRYFQKNKYLTLESSATLISMQGKQLVFVTAHNITKQKNYQLNLQNSEQLYRTLIEKIPQPLAVIQDNVIVFSNQAFIELSRAKNLSHILGQNIMELLIPEDREKATRRMSYIFKEKKALPPIEYRLKTLENNIKHVSIQLFPLSYLGRDALLILVQDKEVTDIKQLDYFKTAQKEKINPSHKEILNCIYMNNIKNIKPCYSEIGEYLKLSKPTVRLRIRQLKKKGLVKENKRGRQKEVFLTEKGMNISL